MVWHRRLPDLAGVLFLGIVLLLVSWRCWSLLRPADQPHHPMHMAMCDFQDVVYYPARAALAGVNPYDARPPEQGGVYFSRFPAGNLFPLYAPLTFVFSLPLAVLPLVPAEIIYWALNVGLLLLLAYVLLRIGEVPCHPGTVAGLAAILLLSRPGHANIYFGAIALPMTLATLAAWRLADRRPWLSAICLAISFIKPTFGGPLFVLLLLRGNYRAAVSGLGITAIANAVVLALFLPQELNNPQPLALLANNQAVVESDPAVDPLQSASRVDLPMVAERLWGRRLPGVVRTGLSLLVLGIAGWNLRRLALSAPANDIHHRLLATALACLTVAICIYHNIYDALLAAVAGTVAWRALANRSSTFDRRLAWPLLACVAVPAVNYFSSKQFLLALARLAPPLADIPKSSSLWTLLCVLNGVCLTMAWCLLLAMVRSEISRTELAGHEPAAATNC